MKHPHEPVNAIKDWEDWYKNASFIAQMDEPFSTKDSRETMHDTTDAVDSAAKAMWMSKAQEHFADTLAEFQYELSGNELYKAFCKAAYENAEGSRKEYEKAKELLDILRYSTNGQD